MCELFSIVSPSTTTTTAGAFNKSDTPVEARQFGDKTNETNVVGAGFVVPPSDRKPPADSTTMSSTSTTSTTTEFPTIPPININDELTPSVPPPQDEEITYGEKKKNYYYSLLNCHLIATSHNYKSVDVKFKFILLSSACLFLTFTIDFDSKNYNEKK